MSSIQSTCWHDVSFKRSRHICLYGLASRTLSWSDFGHCLWLSSADVTFHVSCSNLLGSHHILGITLIASPSGLSGASHRDSYHATYCLVFHDFSLKAGWKPPEWAVTGPTETVAAVASQCLGSWAWLNESWEKNLLWHPCVRSTPWWYSLVRGKTFKLVWLPHPWT
jgi:hypothetical protein